MEIGGFNTVDYASDLWAEMFLGNSNSRMGGGGGGQFIPVKGSKIHLYYLW